MIDLAIKVIEPAGKLVLRIIRACAREPKDFGTVPKSITYYTSGGDDDAPEPISGRLAA